MEKYILSFCVFSVQRLICFVILCLIVVRRSTTNAIRVIDSSGPVTYLLDSHTTLLFCESDRPFDLCIWSYGDDAKCVSSSGKDSNGTPCRDLPSGFVWNIESKTKCGILIDDPQIGIQDGDYTCLLGSFEDISTGKMNIDSANMSVHVAAPSTVQLFISDQGVIHLSNTSQEVNTKVICSSEGGIPPVSKLSLYVNGISMNESSDGSFHLNHIGIHNDGDVLVCSSDQFSDEDLPLYINITSKPLSLHILYPPQIVNRHEYRFMYEFMANPEPERISWELLDNKNNSLIYQKTETEIKPTGPNKYLATLLIDMENVTVCEYTLTIENSEGSLKESIDIRSADSSKDKPGETEDEIRENEETNSNNTSQWDLIGGIVAVIILIGIVAFIFYVAIRRCKYSRGYLYSAPRDESTST